MDHEFRLSGESGPRHVPGSSPGLSGLAGFLIAGTGVYLARDVLIPLALAVLLSFTLAPAVNGLRRTHVGRTAAVIIIVGCAFALMFAVGALITSQVGSLAQGLAGYELNIEAKIRSLRGALPTNGLIERTSSIIHELGRELNEPAVKSAISRDPLTPANGRPVPVQIWEPEPGPMQMVERILSPLLPPVATTGLILLLVVVMLLHREDLRNRMIGLLGSHDLTRATHALDDAAHRLSRYLLAQTALNTSFGGAIAVGLTILGVPNPLLWGLVAMLCRFVPYIGAALASIFPLALAIAVDPGWTLLAWTAALYLGLELVIGNIVEPWLYSSRTGLSPIAVIFAAVVWTWLWGPIGLLLSTPLTVCLVVLGRHVPQLAFLDIALGNEPVLTPPERHYQRLIAGDPDEATEQAEAVLAETEDLVGFYDAVALPALMLAAHDRARGSLDSARLEQFLSAAFEVIENLDHRGEGRPSHPGAEPAATFGWQEGTVLCIGPRGGLDEVSAAMLAQLLARNGYTTRIVPSTTIGPRALAALELEGVRMICLCYVEARAVTHARYLTSRLRRRAPGVPILVGFWGMSAPGEDRDRGADAVTADGLATSLREMLTAVETRAAALDTEEARTPVDPGAKPSPTSRHTAAVPETGAAG